MACIRRALIALLLCALWFAPEARADQNYDDQGAAYAGCQSSLVVAGAHAGATPIGCDLTPNNGSGWGFYTCRVTAPGGTVYTCGFWHGGTHSNHIFPAANTCSTRGDEYGWRPPGGVAGGNVCFQGCTYTYVLDVAGNFFSPTGSTCTTADAPDPVFDADGDGVPDDEDAFPDDPNESADSDGDGIGDNADFSPNDPTDGSDTPGEEDGDDEGDNTASGGGDCKAPPSCQGDGIQCNQLFQQWQIRCSGATVTGDPTNCSAGYSCAGDSAQCAMVALSRKTACGVEGLGEGGQGGTQGDANGNGVADVLEGSGSGDTGDPGEDVEPTRFGLGVSPDILDQENIFGGGQCPEPPTFQIMGVSINGGNMPYWCTAMAILRACILIFGTYAALKILTGWGFA